MRVGTIRKMAPPPISVPLYSRAFLSAARGTNRIPGILGRKLSSIFGTLVPMMSTPGEMEEMVKEYYARPRSVENWGTRLVGTSGKLYREESAFVAKYLKGKKTCLVLQSGGGRESLALAQLGFEVTGIDCCEALVERAKDHAKALSLSCRFEIGEMSEGTPLRRKFDALFLTQHMYSAIPTRERRITFLRKARTFLAEDGLFYLEFYSDEVFEGSDWKFRIKRALARLCGRNQELEIGDSYDVYHFLHDFNCESELLAEFEEADLAVVDLNLELEYAVLTPLSFDCGP